MEQLTARLLRRQRRRQGGTALFMALIALVAMMLASLALIRAVDTANLISGNLAFKQGTLSIGDIGIEAAVSALPTITSTSLDAAYPSGCTTACQYYPIMSSTDGKGRQISGTAGSTVYAINWDAVPTIVSPVTGYTVRYVIDRLCQGPAPVTDVVNKCLADTPLAGGSKKAGATVFSATTSIYYRVTVRIQGPRNTESYVQSILSR